MYDCANHGVGQPLSRERVDPDVAEDDAARELAESSMDLREAYRREQASQAPAVAAPAEVSDSDSDDAPLESLITVRRRDDSSDDD